MTPRIKIFTRSFDLRLYRISKALYEDMGYPCVRLTDQSADGYFFTMLRDLDCDIAVNIDEDAFVTDPDAVRELIDLVISGGYANAGYSDGDPATTARDKVVTNPFFNVLNLSLIRTRFDRSLIPSMSYTDAEPYYHFFKWLAGEFSTLYLPCRRHDDGITTVALDLQGRTLCVHSWYSRFYSMPSWLVRRIDPSSSNQKRRIDSLIDEAYLVRSMERPVFSIADRLSFVLNKIVRWVVKVPQRMARWPFKIRRMIARKGC